MSNAVMSAGASRAVSVTNAAGFFIRFVAFVTDTVILLMLEAMLGLLTYYGVKAAVGAAYVHQTYADVLRYVLFIANTAYYVMFWGNQGATPGKKLLGLQVVVPGQMGSAGIGQGRAFVRLIGYTLDTLTLGIGVLIMYTNPERRTLHDLIAGTVVIRK